MSRGLGALQRALLAELEKHAEFTNALELAMATQPDLVIENGYVTNFDATHLVSVRRALHSLHRRALVKLSHDSFRYYTSKVLGRNVRLDAEVLCAWVRADQAPNVDPFGQGHRPKLNPKRCVPRQKARDATLSV